MKYHPQPVRTTSPPEDNVSMALLCKVSKLTGPAEEYPVLGCDYVGVSLCFDSYMSSVVPRKKTSWQLSASLYFDFKVKVIAAHMLLH